MSDDRERGDEDHDSGADVGAEEALPEEDAERSEVEVEVVDDDGLDDQPADPSDDHDAPDDRDDHDAPDDRDDRDDDHDDADPADDALLSRLRVIEDQPLAERAVALGELHDELRARLEAGDSPRASA